MIGSRWMRRCGVAVAIAGVLVAGSACEPAPPPSDHIEVTHLDIPKPGAYLVETALNNRGDVVLTVPRATGDDLYPAVYLWRDGEADLIAREDTRAEDISDKGHVVANGRPVGGRMRPLLWFRGGWTELPYGDAPSAAALTVNNHGTVAGVTRNGSAIHNETPVVWDDGELIPAPDEFGEPAFAGISSPVVALNNRDQVLMMKFDTDESIFHSWLWSVREDEVIDLREEVGEDVGSVIAHGLNDRGMVLFSYDDAGGTRHQALWHDGEVTDLGALSPRLLNDRGQVVGTIQDADGNRQTVLWDDGETTVLEGLSGFQPTAINNRGQVVGFGRDAEGGLRPYLWQDGRVADLGELVEDAEAFQTVLPLDINDRGQIVGSAIGAEDDHFAVMWEVSPSWGHYPKG